MHIHSRQSTPTSGPELDLELKAGSLYSLLTVLMSVVIIFYMHLDFIDIYLLQEGKDCNSFTNCTLGFWDRI